MKLLRLVVLASLALAPVVIAGPSQAATAFQNWAQGRGTYVPSKERLSDFQDDLAIWGVQPPPAESLRYRWRVIQQRYGVVGQPNYYGGY